MDFTLILKQLGDFGNFQRLIFLLICIVELFVGINLLANVFLMGELKHRCYVPACDNASTKYKEPFVEFSIPNVTDEYGERSTSSCTYYARNYGELSCKENSFNRSHIINCKSYVWDKTEFESTTISEFNIVCDKSWDEAFSSSFFMIGVLVGSAIFGLIADRYGRKTVIIIASTMLLISSTTTAFSSSFEMFSFLRFITAASVIGLVQSGYILVIEFVGTSKRLICSVIIQVMFSVGELLLVLSAYYFRKWRITEFSVSIPGVILLSYYWILPESVRWLISKGKYERAIETIIRAANCNKVVIPENYLIVENLTIENNNLKKVGPLSLFKTPRLRKWSLNIFLNWTVNTLVYYGLALSAGHLYGDIYMNFTILALVEIPSILMSMIVLVHFGPRRILCAMMILAGIACGATAFAPTDVLWISILLAVIGRSSIAVSFSLIYLYSSEIFPTVVRSTGLGLSSTFGRIGSIIAPIIIQLGEVHHSLPMIIFSISSIVSGLLTLALPETYNKQLPDTIEEVENFGLSKESSQGWQYSERKSHLFGSIQDYSSEEENLLANE